MPPTRTSKRALSAEARPTIPYARPARRNVSDPSPVTNPPTAAVPLTYHQDPTPPPTLLLPLPSFPTPSAFQESLTSYLSSLHPSKRPKALLSTSLLALVYSILSSPGNTLLGDAQTRFWAKRQFHLSLDLQPVLMYHSGLPPAPAERLWGIITGAHARVEHGGRDKTVREVQKEWACVPKEVVGRYVKACPGCRGTRRVEFGTTGGVKEAEEMEATVDEDAHVDKPAPATALNFTLALAPPPAHSAHPAHPPINHPSDLPLPNLMHDAPFPSDHSSLLLLATLADHAPFHLANVAHHAPLHHFPSLPFAASPLTDTTPSTSSFTTSPTNHFSPLALSSASSSLSPAWPTSPFPSNATAYDLATHAHKEVHLPSFSELLQRPVVMNGPHEQVREEEEDATIDPQLRHPLPQLHSHLQAARMHGLVLEPGSYGALQLPLAYPSVVAAGLPPR